MIKEFNEVATRDTAVIYSSNLEQIKEYYSLDPVAAGELAISIIEVALTGQMSTDNPIVKMALANYKDVAGKNGIKYDKRVEAKKEARIEKLQLRTIAKLYLEGHSQKEIAAILKKGTSTISDNLKIIRAEFPDLLRNPENSADSYEFGGFDNDSENSDESGKLDGFDMISLNPENPENPEHDNVNVNVNDNVNVNVFSSNDEKEEVSADAETLQIISWPLLEQMGARFKWIDGETVEIEDTKKRMRVIF